MARINLLGGTYLARSVIADAQRCLNLYPEKNPEDAAAPYTHLLTPGSVLKATPSVAGVARCLYTATNGSLYYVCGQNVYYIDSSWTLHLLGTLAANLTTPVAMQDNGNVIVLVDGTSAGYAINLQSGIVGRPLAGIVLDAGNATSGQPSAYSITPGSGGKNGTYSGSALIGGSGTGATADIIVSNPISATTLLFLTATVTTSLAHGLSPGDSFTLSGYPSANSYLNAAFVATSGTAGTTINFNISSGHSGSVGNGSLTAGGLGGVTSITANQTGTGYVIGDTLTTAAVPGLTGEDFVVSALGAQSGTYSNVALSGGAGTGATGEFQLVSGVATSFSLDNTGNGYLIGDVLFTQGIPGFGGFQFGLTSVGVAVNAFAAINDPNFLGGVGLGYLDTFIVLSQPNTRNWYSSLSNITFSELTGAPGQPMMGTIQAGGAGTATGAARNVTVSIASPAVVTLSNHGLVAGNTFTFTTTGALPTGISAGTTYYVIATGLTTNSFEFSATNGGSAIDTSGTQSGTQGIIASTQYNNVSLTGGSGTGAKANLTLTGGVVTTVHLLPGGLGYNAGDVLSASLSGTLFGFQYALTAVNAPAFDPTYLAAKTGYPDLLSTLVVVHREIWLLGAFESAEVWYDAGNAAFPFQIMPGVFIQHGCIAPYSVQTHDLNVFWLGVDQAGQGTVFMGAGYSAKRISTYAIEKIISGWVAAGANLADAVGMIYKQQDHVFYVLSSGSANATIVYDVTENLWHERAWTDPNSGLLNRVRANCMAFAYGANVVGDWQNGNIYELDLNTFTDANGPITRRRGFPHLLNDGKRHSIDRFALDMDCGNGDAQHITAQQLVQLEVSYDRGHTFFECPTQSMGAQGDYLYQMQWRQVSGIGRDFVLQVTWSGAAFTGIQGAWLDTSLAET